MEIISLLDEGSERDMCSSVIKHYIIIEGLVEILVEAITRDGNFLNSPRTRYEPNMKFEN
jgi:hypothetical protein